MKPWLIALFAALLLLPCIGMAETAQDITEACLLNDREFNRFAPDDLRDRDHISFYTGSNLTITAPAGQEIGGLVLRWRTINPPGVILKTEVKGQWQELQRAEPDFAAQYIALKEPVSKLRLSAAAGKLELCEVQVITPGEPGKDVQIWRDPPEKVDLMLFSTHPDDEVLWFGGLLPYYAGEKDMDVLVVNAVYGWYFRRQELLDALWTCGIDIYPVMLGYPDTMAPIPQTIEVWSQKNRQPKDRPVALIRQYKPDVVVLHDVDGEYCHSAHKTFCYLGQQAVNRAADETQHAESIKQWGTWDVPKTYIHLWEEDQLRMDWNQPLSAFDGKTGLQIADEAFHCHLSQVNKQYRVEDGGEYDNALFGLWRTRVGADLVKNDLFENIPAE